MIKFTSFSTRVVVEYLTLFFGMLFYFLVGFELMKCLGVYREGDMVNLKLNHVV